MGIDFQRSKGWSRVEQEKGRDSMDTTGALDDHRSCPQYMWSEVPEQFGVLARTNVDTDIDSH